MEVDEDLMLTINSSSLRDGVTHGNPGEATVTIVDNDCKYINSNALNASTETWFDPKSKSICFNHDSLLCHHN